MKDYLALIVSKIRNCFGRLLICYQSIEFWSVRYKIAKISKRKIGMPSSNLLQLNPYNTILTLSLILWNATKNGSHFSIVPKA